MQPNEHIWRERRTTTLKDIAESVGVSESTVSVVVNGARSGTRVSANTRAVVLEAAQRLGYRPNFHARSLVSGRSNRIGVYSGRTPLDSRNLFFAELLGGMLEASAELRLNTVVHTAAMSDEDILDMAQTKAVDGLVVHLEVGDRIVRSLAEMRVPAVSVADQVDGIPSVCVADAAGGELLARHLGQLGHRRVLIKQATNPAPSAIARINAFVQTAEALDINVVMSPGDLDAQDILTASDVAHLTVRSCERVTAAVGWCDHVAERICQNLSKLGLSVPGDCAVVGFDGFRLNVARRYDLTTIRAPWAAVGRCAVNKLLSLTRGETVPALTVLPVEFVRGTTT